MIKLNNICKSYNNEYLYDNFNIEFEENKISCILGPSGLGKTTLVNMIAGLTNLDSGEIILPANSVFSYVFQEPRLLEWYNVYDNIDIVLKKYYPPSERKNLIEEILELVDLQGFSKYKISELSGGMAQRVSIARAISYPSNILILDEPFKGLDYKLEEDLTSKLKSILLKDKRTVLYITHDIDQALFLSDYIYILNNKPVQIVNKILKNEFSNNLSYYKDIIKKYL
jgi:NitT/TauT family transport system ATP-binding protein